MRTSIKGHQLPEDFMEAVKLAASGKMKFTRCCSCNLHLASEDAAKTTGGWAETQISGMCEPCFDKVFAEDGE